METFRAIQIIRKMARDRHTTVAKVIEEFQKHQQNGECRHLWPDENSACRAIIAVGYDASV